MPVYRQYSSSDSFEAPLSPPPASVAQHAREVVGVALAVLVGVAAFVVTKVTDTYVRARCSRAPC